jgi:hypothetical protein
MKPDDGHTLKIRFHLVVRHAPIYGFCRPPAVDGGVANARQGRRPGCASRLALAADRLGIIRKSAHVGPLVRISSGFAAVPSGIS